MPVRKTHRSLSTKGSTYVELDKVKIAVTNLCKPQLSHCFPYQIAATHVVGGLNHLVLSHNSKDYKPDHL